MNEQLVPKEKRLTLYPELVPYRTGRLKVSVEVIDRENLHLDRRRRWRNRRRPFRDSRAGGGHDERKQCNYAAHRRLQLAVAGRLSPRHKAKP